MPFVNISLARGKSGEYLQAVSRAVHDALAAELHMKPEDDFQLIRQPPAAAWSALSSTRTRPLSRRQLFR
jgi:phenylpyruvate tautomerase PptA (4-oxalocrotonate tautomerase family)